MKIIRQIFDDDYGCEERSENGPVFVIAELENENGETEEIRVPESFLYENSLKAGSIWPEDR